VSDTMSMATTRFAALLELAVDMLLMVGIRNENNNDTDMNMMSEFVAVLYCSLLSSSVFFLKAWRLPYCASYRVF
jgi:hypothetical protein